MSDSNELARDTVTLALIARTIAMQPEDVRKKVEQLAQEVRGVVKSTPEAGFLACALVGAEIAVATHQT